MSLLLNGLSGSIAAQAALDAASQNVANALTPGYTRQGAVLAAVGPSKSGASAGDGVIVSSLMRFSDSYKTQQLWRSNSNQGQHQVSQEYFLQLEQVLSDQEGSISAGLDGFFGAMSAASVEPMSSPQRQAIIDTADALAQRFNNLRQVLSLQRASLYQQRSAAVDQVNSLTHDIALLNDQISQTKATGLNPSDLFDQRDNKVDALARLVGVQTVEQPDGGMLVSLRGGQPLVVGARASTMDVLTRPDGTQSLQVNFGREALSLDGLNLGGTVGGLVDYEASVLTPTADALTDFARELSTRVNNVLTSGFGTSGAPGQALFVFDPSSSGTMLSIDASIAPLDLGLSADAAKPGDSTRLLELIELTKQPIAVTSLGTSILMGDVYTQLVGRLAIRSQQNQASLDTSQTVREQAQKSWQSTSGVNTDEEAINLVQYQQMYQANMKVIAVANELFDSVLQMT